jgi:hypothetical protein
MDMICNMALTSWAKLNAVIAILTEEQLYEMLAHEQLTRQRLDIMVRIQQRLNALEGEKRIAELKSRFPK